MRRTSWILGIIAILVMLPVAAQDDDTRGPITWLAYSKVNPGMTEDAVKLTLEEKDLMDGLVADGTILSWGLATPINHTPGDTWNHVEWVTLSDWSKVDAWVGAVMARMNGLDEQTQKARQERAKAIYVEGSHFDEIVRHAVFSAGNGAKPTYFYVAVFSAKQGKSEALVQFFKDVVVPVLDPMVADGTMTSYGMYAPELHLDTDWTHRIWYGLPGLASIDTMTKTFRSSSDPASEAWGDAVFESEGHFDKVLLVLHRGGPEGN